MTAGGSARGRRQGPAPARAVVPGGRSRIAVVAFGGNALVERGEDATQREQIRRAAELAGRLKALVDAGWRCLLVHGNGPQVGDALLRVESAVHQVPPLTLDVCVAESQGSIGFLLETALRNALRAPRAPEPVALLTEVLVRASDPQLHRPTKPVGPFYPRYRAQEIRRRRGWKMIHEPGRGSGESFRPRCRWTSWGSPPSAQCSGRAGWSSRGAGEAFP